jgi:hypothetical protein
VTVGTRAVFVAYLVFIACGLALAIFVGAVQW